MKESEDGDRRRRSPQTHASEEAVGVTRLHPQAHASEEGAGVARPRPSPISQIRATGEGAGVICRRGIFPAVLASPIEDDDLLREILLRLPPQPSSLLRASAVSKLWRCAATDPKFLHRFRLHHRKPPLLGVFHQGRDDFFFTPIMDPPDRIPPSRFDLHLRDSSMDMLELLDCRHGRVLTFTYNRWDEVVVSDPITGEQRRIAIPSPNFKRFNGAVLCASVDHDHVHGSCHSSPFKVVLISDNGMCYPDDVQRGGSHWIIQAEDGAVGFAILSYPHLQMWQSNINCYGVATWVLSKTIDMRTILGLPKQIQGEEAAERRILGCLEDSDEIIISVGRAAYMVQLKSMKSRKLSENGGDTLYHSYKSFYPPGTSIAGGFDGAEIAGGFDVLMCLNGNR